MITEHRAYCSLLIAGLNCVASRSQEKKRESWNLGSRIFFEAGIYDADAAAASDAAAGAVA